MPPKLWHDGYTGEQRTQIEARVKAFRQETRLFFLTGKPANERSRCELQAKRFRERYQTDPAFNLLVRLRRRLRTFVKGRRSDTMTELVGCGPMALRRHFEAQFKDGMDWSNMGDWHIDHIVPCSAFDLGDPNQRRLCFHFTNLQPLWQADNIRKRDRILAPQLPLHLSA